MTPFVLTHRLEPTGDAPELPQHHYDPERQLNVTEDGAPLVQQIDMFGPSYTHNSNGLTVDDPA